MGILRFFVTLRLLEIYYLFIWVWLVVVSDFCSIFVGKKFVMKSFILAIIISLAAVSCGSQPKSVALAQHVTQPTQYTFRVKAEYPHLRTSYTQGLQFIDGELWEGTGEWGESVLQKIDLESGKAEVLARLPQTEFGEGITVLGDKVFQLTWTNNTAHIYDRSGRLLSNARYAGEGWGLTSDGEKLYMSNGTSTIYRINPATFSRESKMTVTLRGAPLEMINELEWIDGKIWANVYTTDQIVIINPKTGVVEGVIDLAGLQKEEDSFADTDVLNGIAYDAATGRILLTGKRWNKIYEIEIVKQ